MGLIRVRISRTFLSGVKITLRSHWRRLWAIIYTDGYLSIYSELKRFRNADRAIFMQYVAV